MRKPAAVPAFLTPAGADEFRRCMARRNPKTNKSAPDLEGAFAVQLRDLGLPEPARQYRWLPGRLFRADFAWPARRVLIEIEGGVFSGGRHGRGAGACGDMEKANLTQLAGYRLYRYAAPHVRDGSGALQVAQALATATDTDGAENPPETDGKPAKRANGERKESANV